MLCFEFFFKGFEVLTLAFDGCDFEVRDVVFFSLFNFKGAGSVTLTFAGCIFEVRDVVFQHAL